MKTPKEIAPKSIQTPKSNECFCRYFHTFPCVISVLITSYDFAANKLMLSQLFPYSLLFDLSTGYILTISYFFAAILAPITETLTKLLLIFYEIEAKS